MIEHSFNREPQATRLFIAPCETRVACGSRLNEVVAPIVRLLRNAAEQDVDFGVAVVALHGIDVVVGQSTLVRDLGDLDSGTACFV